MFIQTFKATAEPMLMLFTCIAIGFIAKKARLLPDNAGTVMAKLETWIFCPALNFSVMSYYCTPDTLGAHAVNIAFGVCCIALAICLAILLGRIIVRRKGEERNIYTYALSFANGGYVGDPLILTIFGSQALSYYKLFYLPFTLIIYTWGISLLLPNAEHTGGFFKKVLNMPTIATLLGMLFGLTGAGQYLPTFFTSSLDTLKGCMGPVAMLLTGFTIAGYNIKEMLGHKKIYAATVLRLIVIPVILIASLFGIKELVNLAFGTSFNHVVLFLAFFACAAPLGLNTIVFPEAYGGNPKTGAGMALISHTVCLITIPILFACMVALFGTMPAL